MLKKFVSNISLVVTDIKLETNAINRSKTLITNAMSCLFIQPDLDALPIVLGGAFTYKEFFVTDSGID